MGQKETVTKTEQNQSLQDEQTEEKNINEKDLHMIEILKKENDILKKQLESLNTNNKYNTLLSMLEVLEIQRKKILSIKKGNLYIILSIQYNFYIQIENTKMTKEKTNLIKTLKDENLRAETHKYTQNLINNNKQRSLTVPSTNNKNKNEINNDNNSKEIKTDNNNINKNIIDNSNNTENNINNNENDKVKKKKKVKKKLKLKKGEKVDKVDKVEKGKKYKLLTYKTINEIRNEKAEEENKIEDNKLYDKNNKDTNENIKTKEVNKINPTISDKQSEKSNTTRRDLLNSLNNLQYNFDNLMEIGVHGNKYLNNKKYENKKQKFYFIVMLNFCKKGKIIKFMIEFYKL